MTANPSVLKIGLLATGDEIIQGDILNTNAQQIAQQLTSLGFLVGHHMVASDAKTDIKAALAFLLQHHQVVIITGGLGPTSDDCTRFAVNELIQQPLVFDEASWAAIVARLQHFNRAIHASNKQQALFPQGSEIIANPNGTAAGCYIDYQDKLIFLLPGPPKECLPMVEQAVLPVINHRYGQGTRRVFKWRLFGVIEAEIAALLDRLTEGEPCTTGYRIDYPYLEVKIYADKQANVQQLIVNFEQALKPYQLHPSNHKALQLLQDYLLRYSGQITIIDSATAGFFASRLMLPTLSHKLSFNATTSNDTLAIKIEGLNEVWLPEPTVTETCVSLHLQSAIRVHHVTSFLPLRQHPMTVNYAIEWLAWEIYQFILDTQ